MKAAIYLTLFIVSAHFAWDVYQDWPSVTGFYDHTTACTSHSYGSAINPFL